MLDECREASVPVDEAFAALTAAKVNAVQVKLAADTALRLSIGVPCFSEDVGFVLEQRSC